MNLGQKQELFMRLLPRLIDKAYELGYQLRGGELLRPQLVAETYAAEGKGISNSLHLKKLAIDLNLFKDGVWLKDSRDHKPLGEYWKSLHPLCRWGGDFSKPDGNHYSVEHEGVR